MICKRPKCFEDNNLDILYFFYQCVTEKLFDYTLDTYKLPLLNIHTICKEIIILFNYLVKNNSRRIEYILDPFFNEFDYILSKDSVAQNIINDINQKSFKNRVEYIKDIDTILNKLYYEELKRKIINIISCNIRKNFDYKSYHELDNVINMWLIELKYRGYKKEYIYLELRELIKNEKLPIDENKIQGFINAFDFERKEWLYKLKINCNPFAGYFNKLVETMKRESVKIIAVRDTDNIDIKNVEVSVLALDPYRGYEIIVEYFDWIAEYVLWIRHVEKDIIIEVKCCNYKWSKIKTRPVMLRRFRSLEAIYERALSLLLHVQFVNNKKIRGKLDSVIKIHGVALKNGLENANVLLHLWTALELLFVKNDNKKGEQINHSVVEIIQRTFLYKRINYLFRDFVNTIKVYNRELIDKYKLISVDDFMKLLLIHPMPNEISSVIDSNPLLSTRCYIFLLKDVGNAEKILKTMNKHKKIIEWEINRIYVLRNMLVHTGKSIFYEKDLTEHLHNYLDYSFNYVLLFLIKNRDNSQFTIGDIIKNTKCYNDKYINVLKQNKIKITKDNYDKFLMYKD